MHGQAQIVIDRVIHSYRPARGRSVLALANVSLEVRPCEFLALLAPSGCGKSTWLYLVGGFLPAVAGRIVDGKPDLLGIWRRTPKTVIFVTHDVQEAVYLADRVAVMSARPGRLKAIVETRFGHRDPSVRRSKEFVEKVEEIWNLVHVEAIKAREEAAP